MEEKPLISVIIRSYNAAKYIDSAIDSALNQTYRPIEIVIVDDGSSDGTYDRIAPRIDNQTIRYVSQNHQGPWPAANRGLDEAKGEYIQFLDADDLLLPHKLEKQMGRIARYEPGTVMPVCDYRFFCDEEPGQWFGGRPNPERPVDLASFISVFGFDIVIHSILFPARVFRDYGQFDPALPAAGDREHWTRLIVYGMKPIFDPEVMVLYRRHSQNLTSRSLTVAQGIFGAFLRSKALLQERGWQPFSREEVREEEEMCRYVLAQQLLLHHYPWEACKQTTISLALSSRRRQAKILLLIAILLRKGDKSVEWVKYASDRLWRWRSSVKRAIKRRHNEKDDHQE
ncbi:MAG: glycosyltransferase [Armatimonadetes bacterium]|nr:glycosyltransferase [Armatimonadota bacterium]